MLSKFAPKDWKIYVKEHSSQWHIKLRGESGRPSDFYDKVSALPNVQLIPLSTSNFDLIDHAKAVVTITGTAGWEAAVRGKPVLIFGHAWYKFCEGVFYVSSKEDCKNAFLKIQSGYIVDKELVRLFLSAIQQIGVKAFIEPAYEKILNIPYEKNVSILTSTIHGFYSQIPSKKN
jgi:capsule polysaccharide export protein KpsC/LpsZ